MRNNFVTNVILQQVDARIIKYTKVTILGKNIQHKKILAETMKLAVLHFSSKNQNCIKMIGMLFL